MVHEGNVTAATVQLADCLQARGYRTKVIEALAGPVRLRVSNPAAAALTETIIIHAGAFWWPWRDQIGTEADVPGAADIIARVLAALDETP
ncbi:MAG TPA: hypothetical protein VNF47_04850 [Streptosporangiaceae bacterium]|nr:hypothetical protein [Streptosporangiaceae bacterium]